MIICNFRLWDADRSIALDGAMECDGGYREAEVGLKQSDWMQSLMHIDFRRIKGAMD
jgi:hypothetical protein